MKKATPCLLAAAALAVGFLPTEHARAASSTWNVDAGGTWSTAGNWNAGAPGATGTTNNADIATFIRSTITAARSVTNDAAYNIGGITFTNAGTGASYTITNSGGFGLLLSAGAVVQSVGTAASANIVAVNMTNYGSVSFSNNSSSTLQIGANAAARSITAAADMGSVTITFGGTNTSANNLAYATYSQGANTTLGIVKDGSGTWQLNNIGGTMTGGILFKNGTLQFGQNVAAALGAITVGDSSSSGTLTMGLGSGVTVSSAINITNSAPSSVVFSRIGGSGAASFAGAITLARDLELKQGGTQNLSLSLTAASSVTGTGNLIITSSVASAGAVNLQGSVNMAGELRNLSTVATGDVVVSGAIGGNVTNVVQNSTTSKMVLANSANAYTGNTTITKGTLVISNAGTLGNSDLVLNGGTLDITAATTGLTITNGRSIKGSGAITSTGKTFTLNGTLAPGASPGAITNTGDFTLGSTANTITELAGSGGVAGVDFDYFNVTGNLALDGSLLITNYNSFSLDTVGTYNLFDWATKSGNFTNVTVGVTSLTFSGSAWTGDNGISTYTFDTTSGDLNIAAVPEPSTLALFGLGAGALFFFRRRKA